MNAQKSREVLFSHRQASAAPELVLQRHSLNAD